MSPYPAAARLWPDAIIDPLDKRIPLRRDRLWSGASSSKPAHWAGEGDMGIEALTGTGHTGARLP